MQSVSAYTPPYLNRISSRHESLICALDLTFCRNTYTRDMHARSDRLDTLQSGFADNNKKLSYRRETYLRCNVNNNQV